MEVFYIGKGQEKRAYNLHNRNTYWKNIVNKNKGVFIVEFITKNLSEQDAILHERYLISLYGRKDLGTGSLVNLTDGGEGVSGYVYSKERKEYLRSINIGRKMGPMSEEQKLKISLANRGTKRKPLSKEHIDKLIIAHKGKKRTKTHSINIGLGHRKKVLNIDTGEIYNSVKEASIILNISSSHLNNVLKGRKLNKFNLRYYKDCP